MKFLGLSELKAQSPALISSSDKKYKCCGLKPDKYFLSLEPKIIHLYF